MAEVEFRGSVVKVDGHDWRIESYSLGDDPGAYTLDLVECRPGESGTVRRMKLFIPADQIDRAQSGAPFNAEPDIFL